MLEHYEREVFHHIPMTRHTENIAINTAFPP
nr:MAG TPA: hypothetical protein [Caudoviricetes sp.]